MIIWVLDNSKSLGHAAGLSLVIFLSNSLMVLNL